MRDRIREKIKSFLDDNDQDLSDEDPLVTSERLSSLKIVELASWLENEYGINFSARSFNVYDFETVNTVVALVEKNGDL